MKDLQKDEHRLLFPELSSVSSLNYPPIQLEVLTPHERRTSVPRETKDVQTLLDPDAVEALRAALTGKNALELTPPMTKPESTERRVFEGPLPVLKTSTGSFVVTPTPSVSLSFPNRPIAQRPHTTPPALGLPYDRVLFTTPERRINVAATPKTPFSSFLVQAGGQYCIVSGGEAARSVDTRMLPIDVQPHVPLTKPTAECKNVHPPTMFLKRMNTTVSLAPKLQSPPRPPQQLSSKLMERPNASGYVQPLTSGSLAVAAENLKNMFMSGSAPLPVTPIEELNIPSGPSESRPERSDVGHKRRKTSTPDQLPKTISAMHQAGLELLLQAAQTVGDNLPLDVELPSRRSHRGRKETDDHSFSSFVERCLDPSHRRSSGVLGKFTGVYPLLNGSFVARCRFRGSFVLIGEFPKAEDAARAYDRVALSIRGRKSKTNFPYSEYLSFELANAKRAFEEKYNKQNERTRRGSIWPWARAAHTLLVTDEEGSDNGVQECSQSVGSLSAAIPGKLVFKLLQDVMLQKKDLYGTYELIQSSIRQLEAHITSGQSSKEDCECVGQYARVSNILKGMISMQSDWERLHRSEPLSIVLGDTPSLTDPLPVPDLDRVCDPMLRCFMRLSLSRWIMRSRDEYELYGRVKTADALAKEMDASVLERYLTVVIVDGI